MPVAVYAVYSNFHEKTAHSTGIWFLTRVCGGFCRGGDDVAEAAFFRLLSCRRLHLKRTRWFWNS